MKKHYLKIALRYIMKNKLFSFINVFGLSVAFAFCVLIAFFVKDEYSYDRFHKNVKQLYILTENWMPETSESRSVYLPLPFAPVIPSEIPEVKNAIRISEDNVVIRRGDKIFPEAALCTDPGFFNVFSFNLQKGHGSTALSQLNNVVLTSTLARKYFGDENPVGKQLAISIMNVEENYLVTGVSDDPPSNSSIRFSLLLRIEKRSFYDHMIKNWRSHNTPTIVELASNVNVETFKRKLAAITNKYFEPAMSGLRKGKNLPADAKVFELEFVPIQKLHLSTDLNWPNTSNPKYTYILSGIALLILIIACINFISLSLTSASGRTIEVGVRKVVGASRIQLIKQYWSEALLMGAFSLVLGLLLVQLFLPLFNELTSKNISLGLTQRLQATGFILFITLLISVITGGYPALFLSSFHPAHVLKGRNTYRFKPGLIKGLVVVQYALSAFLLISAIVMYRQMKYVAKKDLGYEKEQLLAIPTYTGYTNEGTAVLERLRTRLQNDPAFLNISGTSSPPSNSMWSLQGYDFEGKEKGAYIYRSDYDFIETMRIELVEGRDFSRSFPTDTSDAVIVNEALVKDLGWKEPIGKEIAWMGKDQKPAKVIGVVKDFNFLSLENKVQPLLLYMKDYDKIQYLLVRINPEHTQAALNKLQTLWKEVNPNKPFDFVFQGESVARQYSQYQRWVKIMGISTIMAVIIACLGLFGLAGIMAVNKTKEIGIRKVFGADIKSLMILLNKDIVKLSVLSFILALPLAWYIMNKWLENFAYRITITFDIIIVAAVTAFAIALVTVSYHSLKAALSNPAKSLRTE